MFSKFFVLTSVFVSLLTAFAFAEYGVSSPSRELNLVAKSNKAKVSVKNKKVKKKKVSRYIIDSFSDGNFSVRPEWWQFGRISMSVVANKKDKSMPRLGKKSLQVRGLTNRYYAGGMGVYIGQDGFKYTDVVLRLFSPAPFSSILRIELYDDDNGNGSVDLELGKNEPISDDVFVYNLIMDWEGWKEVRIPIDAFEDDNPTVGDNIMNPYKLNNSEGLLQAQLVFLSIKESEQEIFLKLDYIGLEGTR